MNQRRVVVHVASQGNAFMVDIASWIAEAARITGREATISADGSLPSATSDALSLVVAPHEFYALSSHPVGELRQAATSSIPIATEQPGTPWFNESIQWCRLAPWSLDINEYSASALVAEGVDARFLRLGAVPSMDHRRCSGLSARPIDVVVLAGWTATRAEHLAKAAQLLWPFRSEIRLFPTDRPVTPIPMDNVGGPLFGPDKYALLAQSRVLINLHRDGRTTYFEWARVVEAMANGCVVVTEPSRATEPLVDGVHFVAANAPVPAAIELLDDHDRLRQIGDAGADVVHDDLAPGRTLDPILAAADATLNGHKTVSSRIFTRRTGRDRRPHARRATFRPHLDLRRRVFDAVTKERRLRRDIDAERCRLIHGSPDHLTIVDSPAWSAASADVSAIITLFNYAEFVEETLDSVAASEDINVEIVVVDDHSTDTGRAVVSDWINNHPHLPIRLVRCDANRGLATARNIAIDHTRTERVMVLDADNLVYPTCLTRLAVALDSDGKAAFSWSILERFGDEVGLLSAFAWDPERLAERNWIDAQVMLRRSSWHDLGGYREMTGLMPGWEDWDLWLRMASAGCYGVLVPQILGRSRSHTGSMVSGPNRFVDVMMERFEALHPDVDFQPR